MSNFYKHRIEARKEFLINFLSDSLFIIIILIINNIYDLFLQRNYIYLNIFIFSWVVIGYILGRFHNEEIFLKSNFLINILFQTFYVSIFSTLITYAIFLFKNRPLINNIELNNIISFIFIWNLVFTLVNYFIKSKFTNKLSKKQIWYFIGSKEVYQNLDKGLLGLNNKIELRHFNNKLNFKNLNNLKIAGFCSDSFYKMSDEELRIFMKSKYINSSIMSIQKWYEIHLECLPPKLVTKTYVLRGNFLINKKIYPRFKKVADILISILLLILTSPIILLCALLIYLEDRGNIFYSQKRIGLFGKPFTIYKLRSMKVDAEKEGPQWASFKDERITFIGEIIRKTRLDELPQLICVIKGEMSLIGPRPERKEFEDKIEKEIPNYKIRHLIKPGLSGWAQVNYPYGASLKDAENKLSLDLFYIRNFSLFIDLIIFIKTIKLVANRKGAKPFQP